MTPAEKNQLLTRILLTIAALPIWIAGITALTWATIIWTLCKWVLRQPQSAALTWQWILSYDQHANALAFGNRDEYISTRAGRCARKGGNRPCVWLCKLLSIIDTRAGEPSHCERSIKKDQQEAIKQTEQIKD